VIPCLLSDVAPNCHHFMPCCRLRADTGFVTDLGCIESGLHTITGDIQTAERHAGDAGNGSGPPARVCQPRRGPVRPATAPLPTAASGLETRRRRCAEDDFTSLIAAAGSEVPTESSRRCAVQAWTNHNVPQSALRWRPRTLRSYTVRTCRQSSLVASNLQNANQAVFARTPWADTSLELALLRGSYKSDGRWIRKLCAPQYMSHQVLLEPALMLRTIVLK